MSDPFNPMLIGSVELGGIVARTAHPRKPEQPLNGGPQMVEVSRDGRRVYVTNSLYTPVGRAVLPGRHPRLDGQGRRCARGRHGARSAVLRRVRGRLRPHQVRLQGGDASSDSFCFS